MPTTVNEQAIDALTLEEVKNIAGLHALTAGLSGQNQLTNQQAVDVISREALQSGIAIGREWASGAMNIGRAVQARAIRFIMDTSAQEAISFTRQISSDLTSKLADIEGMLAAGMQQEKTAISTPPQTGTGGAFGSSPGTALYQQLAEALALVSAIRDTVPKPA
jgi:hypothetical protein